MDGGLSLRSEAALRLLTLLKGRALHLCKAHSPQAVRRLRLYVMDGGLSLRSEAALPITVNPAGGGSTLVKKGVVELLGSFDGHAQIFHQAVLQAINPAVH